MSTRTLLTTALVALAGLATMLPAPARAIVKTKRAYFTAKISGLQTTKWNFTSGTYTDCNGTSQTKGEGTEVFRFSSGSERVTFEGFGDRTPTLRYDQWSRYPLADSPYAVLADAKLTRQRSQVTHWTGGWCQGARDEYRGLGDCGRRQGITSVTFDPRSSRKIEVDAFGVTDMKPFNDCSVSTPDGVDAGGFTEAEGKLSSKLIFGRKKKIVVTGGKSYRREETGLPRSNAFSTTYFKLTLTRHVPKKKARR